MFLFELNRRFVGAFLVVWVSLSGCSGKSEPKAVEINPAEWPGRQLAEFEEQYGPKGRNVGSGLIMYLYEINGEKYCVSVGGPDRQEINNVWKKEG